VKALARRSALNARANDGRVFLLRGLELDAPKTKRIVEIVGVSEATGNVLILTNGHQPLVHLSARNLPNVHIIAPDQLNTYDVLVNDDVVFTKTALEAFLGGPVKAGASAKARESEVKTEEKKPAKKAAEKPAKAEKKAESTEDSETVDFGPGSHAPLPDDEQPEGFPIKGNASSKLYHVPGSSHYNRTVAEVWFATEEDAENAGFQLPPSQRKAKEEDK
jgi:large subunit ribosomal protein L4